MFYRVIETCNQYHIEVVRKDKIVKVFSNLTMTQVQAIVYKLNLKGGE